MKRYFPSLKRVIGPLVFFSSFALYCATLAPSVVPGDPGEYQFIPHILGIAHPPGYAFFALLAKCWTSVVRVGSIAYRTNLLAAAAGAWTAMMACEMVLLLSHSDAECLRTAAAGTVFRQTRQPGQESTLGYAGVVAALLCATVLATSTDLWQHSMHANAHVVSAALAATTLFTGLRWWATGADRWLYTFAFLAALGITHHPLLAVSTPAYVVFVLIVRWRLLLNWRRLAGVCAAMLAGFSVFLYLPLRAGATPFGPSPTADAILGHATARGIRGNLFQFGLADQPIRLQIFWGLLRMQFAPLILLLAVTGFLWLAWRRPRPFVLLALFTVLNVAFTINSVQDVMAYLLLPFTVTAVFAGIGLLGLLQEGHRVVPGSSGYKVVSVATALLIVLSTAAGILHKAPRVSLRDYRLADQYVQSVRDQFVGTGERAVLLAPWEGMTPLHYAQYVEGQRLDPADVTPVFVASGTANPWVEFVWKHIEDGPIYLTDYRPQVAWEGFRLRPIGDWPLYKLEAPPATSLPEIAHPVDLWAGEAIHLLGWDLDRASLSAGETAHLTLYMSSPRELSDYYMPYLGLGDRLYRWTTDSRLNTPWWQPDEIVVERYDLTVPFGTPPGDYPLDLGVSNVSQGQDLVLSNGADNERLPVALHVEPAAIAPPEDVLAAALANLNSRIALLGGHASARGRTVTTPWTDALSVRPGDSVQVWLDWYALTAVDEPYTVFVHLIDGADRIWAQQDYTPMGGAFPTFLWIPRWIEGQRFSDPYRLKIPPDAPPGDYRIEVGMYGMTTLRRVYHFDTAGNLAGDRYIMGPVRIDAP